MYNTEGRRCPVHPTVIRSCPICAEPDNYWKSQSVGELPEWTAIGVPTTIPGFFICNDGQPLAQITDGDLGGIAYYARAFQFRAARSQFVSFRLGPRTDFFGFHQFAIRDLSGSWALVVGISTVSAVPGITIEGGFGTLQSVQARSDGSYQINAYTLPLIVGHSYRIEVRPSGNNLPSDLGQLTVGSIILGPDVNLPDNEVIDGINYQAETATAYNTSQPPSRKHDSMAGLSDELGLDEHWDDPRDRVRPPPLFPPLLGL